MNKKDLKKTIKQKLDEINQKINELKSRKAEETDLQEQIDKMVGKLEDIRIKISKKFTDVDAERVEVWDEMEKDIYRDFEAFDDAFKQAGSLFRSTGEKRSEKSGPFYRPGDETI